jgi:thiamine kinase-like enzyme
MMWKSVGEGASDGEIALEAIIGKVSGWQGLPARYRPVSGGISNANWRVSVAQTGSDAFVKVPGRGTEMFIDRRAAHDASRKAYESGYGAAVLGFVEDDGVEIFEFVEGYRTSTNLDFLKPSIRLNALAALKAFNDGGQLMLTKTIFDMIDEHADQVAELGARMPNDFAWMWRQYLDAKAAIHAAGIDLVPCMNDTLAGNFMIGPDERIMLVDFEYASNNDRAYEIAMWFGEMFFPPAIERELIAAYFGRVDRALEARINIHKSLADLKWATWAMVQEKVSTIDFDFHKYGAWKHMRARNMFHHPDWNVWLRTL